MADIRIHSIKNKRKINKRHFEEKLRKTR